MPTYTFLNKDTGEEFTDFMSISALEEYLASNPNIQQVPCAPAIVDPVGLGITKPPSDFLKNVIGKVKHNQAGASSAALERRWHIPREH